MVTYIKKIHYSVSNGGDGSAYPTFVESIALAEWMQENDLCDEGFSGDCSGSITVKSQSPITVETEIETFDDIIKMYADFEFDQNKLNELIELSVKFRDGEVE